MALIVLVAAAIAPAVAGLPDELRGAPRVIDGDTLEVAGRRIDLFGIDAPELDQTCTRDRAEFACGEVARAALLDLTAGLKVVCRPVGGRASDAEALVARCSAGGFSLSENMLYTGWALALPQAAAPYPAVEAEARAAGRGLWQGDFVPPWEWREGRASGPR